MFSSTFMRWCAIVAILGGLLYTALGLLSFLGLYLYSPMAPGDFPLVLQYIGRITDKSLLFVVPGAMGAIAGLHALQRAHYGLVGTLASLIAFLGVVLLLVGTVIESLLGPTFEPSLLFLIGGLLISTIGLTALGAITISTRVLPWWCGTLLILGSPLLALFLPGALQIVLPYEILHPLLVGGVWTLVGYSLLRQARVRPTPHPSRVS
jgi:hypothetical protein